MESKENLPADRINWKKACEILGCSKSMFYRLVRQGALPAYGVGGRFRTVSKADCEKLAAKQNIGLDTN